MLDKEFQELIDLEQEKQKLLDENKRIQNNQPVMQPYPCFWETLDKATKIAEQQAEIWNNIRGYIIKDKKTTLWQLALKSNYPVKFFGEENIFMIEKLQLEVLKNAK